MNNFSSITLYSGTHDLVAKPYYHLVKTINPAAKFTCLEEDSRFLDLDDYIEPAMISGKGDGLITNVWKGFQSTITRDLLESKNFFKKEILSRLSHFVAIVAAVITRVADAILGAIAAVLSLITLGNFHTLNNVAYRGLQAPAIINDILFHTRKILNPHF